MKRTLLAAALVLGILASATVGHAATLAVNAGSLTSFTTGHPCEGSLAVTTPTTAGTSSTVTVTVTPAACAGRTIAVAVDDGAVVRQGTASGAATVTITLDGAYTPSTSVQVAATIIGWGLPATWSYTPPPAPGSTIIAGNAFTLVTAGGWYTSGGLVCADVTVQAAEKGNREWRVDVYTTAWPFNGATTGYVFSGPDANRLTLDPMVGDRLRIVGTDSLHQSNSPTRHFTICH